MASVILTIRVNIDNDAFQDAPENRLTIDQHKYLIEQIERSPNATV